MAADLRFDGNRARFVGTVDGHAHYLFVRRLDDFRRRGHARLVLDFSKCERADVEGMLPLVSGADALRSDGVEVDVELPTKGSLRRVFEYANWAHLLAPERFPERRAVHELHLAAQRFRGPEEQQQLVSASMDVLMRNLTLDRQVLAGLEWSVNEITDNVLNHAECEDGGIVQVNTMQFAGKVVFGVADSGKGILSSLREGHPHLRTDADAIREAMKAGITRSAEVGQGNGIVGALRVAVMSGGKFAITSGAAQVEVRRDPQTKRPEPRVFDGPNRRPIPGTVVYAEVGLDSPLDLPEALAFGGIRHQPVDIIETKYETEAGNAVVLRMHGEPSGFGSRSAGRQLRTKCWNLLNAEPTKPLLLDWTGVRLVSSSFADELLGKLFASLGPVSFSARVRNLGMEPVVRGLVDKAILQRAAQLVSGLARQQAADPPDS